jgi:2'-5' RNA ligase
VRTQKTTIGVAIGIPEPYAEELRTWRERAGDPQAKQVFPHVTLLPPTEVAGADLAAIADHLSAVASQVAPFAVHLRGTGTFRPVSEVVFVTVAAGIAGCEQLERGVRSGPLARRTVFPYHPHVTIAQDVPTAALDYAYEGLSAFEARFEVCAFTMFEQDADGVWQPQRDFPLTGAEPTG